MRKMHGDNATTRLLASPLLPLLLLLLAFRC
jgi:hypothetical protein